MRQIPASARAVRNIASRPATIQSPPSRPAEPLPPDTLPTAAACLDAAQDRAQDGQHRHRCANARKPLASAASCTAPLAVSTRLGRPGTHVDVHHMLWPLPDLGIAAAALAIRLQRTHAGCDGIPGHVIRPDGCARSSRPRPVRRAPLRACSASSATSAPRTRPKSSPHSARPRFPPGRDRIARPTPPCAC